MCPMCRISRSTRRGNLGVDDSTSIWFFQIVGKEFRFIDYYENSGYGMAHYAGVLKEKPYVYGDHYMPHDADQRMQGASEIAQSKKEIAEQLGIKPVVVIARARNIDAILLGIRRAAMCLPNAGSMKAGAAMDSQPSKDTMRTTTRKKRSWPIVRFTIGASRPKHIC